MLAGDLRVCAAALANLPDLFDRPVAGPVKPRSHMRLLACALQRVQKALALLIGVFGRVSAELDKQPGVAGRHQLRMALEALLQLVVDQLAVERLKSDGAE